MKRLFSLSILTFALVFSLYSLDRESPLASSNPEKYSVTIGVTLRNTGLALTSLVVDLPLPSSSIEQEVEGLKLGGASLETGPGGRYRYAMFVLQKEKLPDKGETRTLSVSYDITLREVSVDLGKIGELFPYDSTTEDFRKYTKNDEPIIDKDNAALGPIADGLFEESGGNPLVYARLAYERVAREYKYQNPNTGIHPLAECLASGGGDCGNLATIFVSMLRREGIPARHVVSVLPDGSFHVWAEFYLERYGWIPVDVAYKNGDPSGDYFGNLRHARNGIIMNRDVNLELRGGDEASYTATLFQAYSYWWSSSGGDGKLGCDFKISATKY